MRPVLALHSPLNGLGAFPDPIAGRAAEYPRIKSSQLSGVPKGRGKIPRVARQIGTGRFKFAEFKPNQLIRVTANAVSAP